MNEQLGKITLFELEILAELGQHASLRSIGRAKNLPPPHLSKILSRLESKLSTRVIQRSPKGFLLTPEGLRFSKLARVILVPTEELSSSRVDKQPTERLISVAASRFVAAHIIAPVLQKLKTIPGIRFRLLDMAPDELVPTALKSACEVLVTVGEPSLPRTWASSYLNDLSWGLYASRRNPITSRSSEAAVRKLPFIIPTYWHGDGYETGDDYCPLPARDRRPGDETSSIVTAIEILRTSAEQLVFAPRIALENYLTSGEVKQIRVKGWPEVRKPVFLSVRNDLVTKSFERQLTQILSPGVV